MRTLASGRFFLVFASVLQLPDKEERHNPYPQDRGIYM